MAVPNEEQLARANFTRADELMPENMFSSEHQAAEENTEENLIIKQGEQEAAAEAFQKAVRESAEAAGVDPKKYLAKTYSAAHSSNYTRGRQGNVVDTIVIHYMAGSYSSTLNWFANPAANVSTTYSISKSGQSAQHIGEKDTGWHTGVLPFSTQTRSIGIEHDGFGKAGEWTEAMLRESARIVAGICARHPRINYKKYGWGGLVGHESINSQKSDPGPNFPWKRHDELIEEFLKGVTSPAPSKPAPAKPSPAPRETLYRVSAGGRQTGAFEKVTGAMSEVGKQIGLHDEVKITKGKA